jgi:hypothetical protein
MAKARNIPGTFRKEKDVPAHEVDASLDEILRLSVTNYVRGQGKGGIGPKILKEQNLGVEEWLAGSVWAVVISSNVASMKYELESQQLWELFSSRKGKPRLYIYYDVPREVAQRHFLSASIGSSTHSLLIGNYVVRQVTF